MSWAYYYIRWHLRIIAACYFLLFVFFTDILFEHNLILFAFLPSFFSSNSGAYSKFSPQCPRDGPKNRFHNRLQVLTLKIEVRLKRSISIRPVWSNLIVDKLKYALWEHLYQTQKSLKWRKLNCDSILWDHWSRIKEIRKVEEIEKKWN